jgi:G:T-mismatch repair DNA endonuclease (very short patch repair protein)/transcriptional regulator with XRE-family HTH domain
MDSIECGIAGLLVFYEDELMYDDLKARIEGKNNIQISLDQNLVIQLRNEVPFLPKNTPIKVVRYCIDNNLTEIPKCKFCGQDTSIRKDTNTFSKFCSSKCRSDSQRFNNDRLSDYDYMYDLRINKRMSKEAIADILGCSVVPVSKAIKKLNIPSVQYNESNSLSMTKLRDKEWLTEQHRDKKRKLSDIAAEIGSTKSTISRWLQFHEIIANNPNSYDRDISKISNGHQEICEFLKSIGVKFKVNDRTILNGNELDILIEDHSVAIEYNGLYWHSHRPELPNQNQAKGRHYHLNKTIECESKGIQLLHIFEDEWLDEIKQAIWKSKIRVACNKIDRRLGARQCKVILLTRSEKSQFLRLNHLQGNDRSSIYLGLVFNDELVSAMTFCKSRYDKNIDWELSRFAVVRNTTIAGGFGKLFKHFCLDHVNQTIVTYADRRHSQGKVYTKNGFELTRTNPSSYWYIDPTYTKRLHRSAFMKSKLQITDSKQTEWEYMQEQGFKRLWDCGTLAFKFIST